MIIFAAPGVDSPQLAASLASAHLCLIAIHLQEQEAQSPREKTQTQLMIIHRGVTGPGTDSVKQHTPPQEDNSISHGFRPALPKHTLDFHFLKGHLYSHFKGLCAHSRLFNAVCSCTSGSAAPLVTLSAKISFPSPRSLQCSLHIQDMVGQSFTLQKFFGRRISTVSQRMPPANNYI